MTLQGAAKMGRIRTKMQTKSTKTVCFSFLLLCLSGCLLCAEANSQATANKKEVASVPDNWLSKNELDKVYQLLVSYKDQSGEDITQEIPYNLIKKFDDYGHLRFGRSGNNANRFKYSDPDYGHMRFGK